LKLKARYYSLMLMRKGDVLFMNMHQKQKLSWFCCKVSEDIKRWEILRTSFMKLLIIHVMRY